MYISKETTDYIRKTISVHFQPSEVTTYKKIFRPPKGYIAKISAYSTIGTIPPNNIAYPYQYFRFKHDNGLDFTITQYRSRINMNFDNIYLTEDMELWVRPHYAPSIFPVMIHVTFDLLPVNSPFGKLYVDYSITPITTANYTTVYKLKDNVDLLDLAIVTGQPNAGYTYLAYAVKTKSGYVKEMDIKYYTFYYQQWNDGFYKMLEAGSELQVKKYTAGYPNTNVFVCALYTPRKTALPVSLPDTVS